MPLITCPDCGNDVSEKAPTCPKCGCPMARPAADSQVTASSSGAADRSGGLAVTSKVTSLPVITDKLPDQHRAMLLSGEDALHFAFIDTKGGCGSTVPAKQWLLVTNQRVLFEATVAETLQGKQGQTYVRRSGSMPISKISFVGTRSASSEGCNSKVVYLLTVNSSGGGMEIVIPTEAEAKRTQSLIDQIIR